VECPGPAAVARALAVLGGEAELCLVAQLSSLEETTVVTVIDALAGAGLVVGLDPVGFARPIVRSSIYGDVPAGEPGRAHLRAARLLDAAGAEAERVAVYLLARSPATDAWMAGVLSAAGSDALAPGAAASAKAPMSSMKGRLLSRGGSGWLTFARVGGRSQGVTLWDGRGSGALLRVGCVVAGRSRSGQAPCQAPCVAGDG
jgi:hypothetical protein